jgi:hypothetical protein
VAALDGLEAVLGDDLPVVQAADLGEKPAIN